MVKIIGGVEHKKCSKCGEWKPNTKAFFMPRYDAKKTLRTDCRNCRNAVKNKWQRNNTEKCQKWSDNWAAKNPDKVALMYEKQKEKARLKAQLKAKQKRIARQKWEEEHKEEIEAEKRFKTQAAKAKARIESRKYRKQQRDKIKLFAKPTHKICRICGEEKPASTKYFSPRKDSVDGYRRECKKCMNEKYRKRYLKNPEKEKERRSQYYLKSKNKISKICNRWANENAKYRTYQKRIGYAEEIRKDPFNSTLIQVRCTYCNKWFNPTNRQIKGRCYSLENNGHGDKRLYCSDACKEACPIFNVQLYEKGFEKGTSREVSTYARKLCLERDNWECQMCGVSEGGLHVHHIKSYALNKIMGSDVDNMITLCQSCHTNVHRQDGCGYHELRCGSKVQQEIVDRIKPDVLCGVEFKQARLAL